LQHQTNLAGLALTSCDDKALVVEEIHQRPAKTVLPSFATP
jgi:hypothetical protein